MNAKDKLLSIFMLQSSNSEFNALLENHEIGDQNVYRLYYINYHRIGETYSNGTSKIGLVNYPCRTFMLPEGMTREEGFKVLSYLADLVEKKDDIEPCSLKSVILLDNLLDQKELGFIRVDESDNDKILNLFTVTGRILLFKKNELYSKYFEWYTENISFDEVKNIYRKYNIDIPDIFNINLKDNSEYSKVLRKKNR